jgi:hypothetical protein
LIEWKEKEMKSGADGTTRNLVKIILDCNGSRASDQWALVSLLQNENPRENIAATLALCRKSEGRLCRLRLDNIITTVGTLTVVFLWLNAIIVKWIRAAA